MVRSIAILTLPAVLLAILLVTAPAGAFPSRSAAGSDTSIVPTTQMPGPLREVGFDQRLNEQVPLDLPFRDEAGRSVRLGEYFAPKSDRPVILVLAYYECPMLCDLVLQGVATTLKPLSENAGKDFDVVVASFDARDKPEAAAESKRAVMARYGRAGREQGWHFLTGPKASIDALTQAVGFRYVYQKERNEFAHPAGLVILTPSGKVSRYLFGIDFPPRYVRLGLLESREGKVGSLVDQMLLYCYHYDPAIGRYSAATMNILRLAAGATVIGLAGLVVVLRRRESHQPGQAGA